MQHAVATAFRDCADMRLLVDSLTTASEEGPMNKQKTGVRRSIYPITAALVAIVFCLSMVERPGSRQPKGHPQLVSIQDFPVDGEWCPPPAPADDTNLFAAFGETSVLAGSPQSGESGVITRPPIRTIRDKDPIYSAVAIDTRFDEVVLMDNNVGEFRSSKSLEEDRIQALP